MVQATELLLQERTPRDVAVARPRADEVQAVGDVREFVPPVERRFSSPHGAMPRTQLLSNGRYAVMLTTAGSGYSRWRDLAITRWREDVTRDGGGPTSSFATSTAARPGRPATSHGAGAGQLRGHVFRGPAEIVRRDRAINTMLQVIVSPEDDGESGASRSRISGRGRGDRRRRTRDRAGAAGADLAHPAFSNLSVQTEYVPASTRCWPPAGRGRGRDSGLAGPRGGGRGRGGRRLAVGDRSRPVPRPRARDPDAGGGDRRPGGRPPVRCSIRS